MDTSAEHRRYPGPGGGGPEPDRDGVAPVPEPAGPGDGASGGRAPGGHGAAGDRPTARRLRRVAGAMPRRDLALWSAGLTFFGMLAAVPFALGAVRLAAAVAGPRTVRDGVDVLLSGIPGEHGVPQAVRAVTATGVALSWPRTVVVLVIATMYGEGLRRAFRQLGSGGPERAVGWRGRLGLAPVLVAAPFAILALLAAAPTVAPRYAAGGAQVVAGVAISFPTVWAVVTVVLAVVYRSVAPGRTGVAGLVAGSLVTGSFVTGFLHGFLVFLAIPVDWSLPFGGLPVIGAVTAAGLWLYLLHAVVLAGYRVVLLIDGRLDGQAVPATPAIPASTANTADAGAADTGPAVGTGAATTGDTAADTAARGARVGTGDAAERWAAGHHGLRPTGFVAQWVRLTASLAGPLVRVPPDLISAAGVVALAGAVAAAVPGSRWSAAPVAVLVVVGGLLDGLDGAVARRSGRARPRGAVVDAVADRVGDVLLAAVLALLGAPVAWCVAAVGVTLLHEYLRARAQALGMDGVGAVTVGERPTRVAVVAVVAAGTAVWPGGTPLGGWDWGGAGAVLWLVTALAGLAHLMCGVWAGLADGGSQRRSSSTRRATMSADSSTNGMPPPGWVEPPTR